MIEVCFWCKRAKGGEGNPVYTDYKPCPVCENIMNQGITIFQVTDEDNGNVPTDTGKFPTGKWVVVSENDAKKVLTGHPLFDTILHVRRMYMNVDDWTKMGLP